MITEELLQLKEDLAYVKEQHLQLAKLYGSELCAAEMERKELEISQKISALEKEIITKEYLLEKNSLFAITHIDSYGDGGTRIIKTSKYNPIYWDFTTYEFYTRYPVDDKFKLRDKIFIKYLVIRIESYIERLEDEIKDVHFFLSKFKGN